ncbi:hypothetical protein [Rhodococcus sp. 27YEA15]|uniref:hypothetical protein n=1 Tax=Rhodococcus sp. 27YEA15 TaxID=3156259 RepID=UPI003C79BE65
MFFSTHAETTGPGVGRDVDHQLLVVVLTACRVDRNDEFRDTDDQKEKRSDDFE